MDSVLLAESNSVYIAKPGEPTVDPYDGSFYVPDYFSNQVYRFGRDGRLLRIYGRPGEGPGEFRWAAAVFTPDDSTLAVVDQRNWKLVFFDRDTGVFRRERRVPGMPDHAAPLVIGDSVWLSLLTPGIRKGLVRFGLGDGRMERIGRLPDAYLTSLDGAGVFAIFNGGWTGYLLEKNGRILQGFRALNLVYLRDRAGLVLDSVFVPKVRRRGVPFDLREKLDKEGESTLDALELTSSVSGLHALPDGKVVLEHHDIRLLNRQIPPATAATVWISLLSADLERACVDAKLSDSKDAQPKEAFRGDTVFQLERRIVGRDGPPGAQRLETWLRIVRIDPSGCDWIPARPPVGEG